jgi:hypothetical protein
MNYQVSIYEKGTDRQVWADGGYKSASEAEHAAELQLIGRDEALYYVRVYTV